MKKSSISFRFIRVEHGGFTLEGSLIFPILFVITMSFIFLCLQTYLQIFHYANSVTTAERTSYTWDNSNKNVINGSFSINQYDDLYWRLFADQSDSLDSDYSKSQSLVALKLKKPLHLNSQTKELKSSYMNSLFKREVIYKHPKSSLIGEGYSYVTEPAEYIRNFNLAKHYIPKIKQIVSSEKFTKTMNKFRNRKQHKELPYIDSHAKARSYTQQLVQGKRSKINTETVGEWREIDALDQENVAHQVYYGAKTYSEVKDQLLKDIELMQRSQVNGVVWHFFKRQSDQSIGPAHLLHERLEGSGIVIVIHDWDEGGTN